MQNPSPRLFARLLALVTILGTVLLLPSIGPASAQDRLPVIASFSILGDLLANVGGDRVSVTVLVGPDGDGHTFQPSPKDARTVADAKLVFVNGAGFEGWMPRLIKASGTKAVVVETSAGIAFRANEDTKGDHDHGHAHDHGADDPHVWQSVANARIMVGNIRDGLIAADPAGKAIYEANASAYIAKLDALEAEITAAVAAIPAERRKVITTHDAFGYFGAAYGVTFIAPQGVSTETEANAKAVARIIRQIREQAIPAVFLENISDPRLIKRIAEETKAKIGGTLFSDALSPPDGPAGTYIDMMRHNIRELTGALSS
jgi:zinc/manganese transport system substrate-binding protein